jgi:hypothetical protein
MKNCETCKHSSLTACPGIIVQSGREYWGPCFDAFERRFGGVEHFSTSDLYHEGFDDGRAFERRAILMLMFGSRMTNIGCVHHKQKKES